MADHSCSLHLNPQQQSVAIAIGAGRDDLQPIARGLALHPELLPRPAEERHIATLQRVFERLTSS